MSLIDKIRAAQVRAGEDAAIASLPKSLTDRMDAATPPAQPEPAVKESLTAQPEPLPILSNSTELKPEPAQGLRVAAQAVIDRWDTMLWKDAVPTGVVINRLRKALAAAPPAPTEQPKADDIWPNEEVEEVIVSLGDDASKLRDANPDDEMADNMDRAASMLQVLFDREFGAPTEQADDCREELAMMIRMLVSALRKARPCAPQDLDYRAINLLRKHGLLGSPLREAAPDGAEQADREDAARLKWVVDQLSSRELRDMGIVYSANRSSIIAAIDAARASQAQQPGRSAESAKEQTHD